MAVRSTSTLAEVISVTGLSQVEAAAYIGRPVATLRMWYRGGARTPAIPLRKLWLLAEKVMRGDDLDPAVPESARRRAEVVRDMRDLESRLTGIPLDPNDEFSILPHKLKAYLDLEFTAMDAAPHKAPATDTDK